MVSSSRDHAPSTEKATPKSAATKWPEERQAALVRLAAEGKTGSEIAAALDTTRNAILGRAHRTGVKLPNDARKRAINRKHKTLRPPEAAKVGGRRSQPAGHPARRTRPWGMRAFTDAEIATAIARHLAGLSGNKAARSISASWQSLRIWERDGDLMAQGRALYEQARAIAAVAATEKAARAAREAEDRRQLVIEINTPILAMMSPRNRAMMERRVAGDTLQAVGDAFEITRERVRQIEVQWRLRGLIVPGARPLDPEAAKRLMIAQCRNPDGSARGPRGRPKGVPNKQPYRITDADRQRRSDLMREISRRRWEARA